MHELIGERNDRVRLLTLNRSNQLNAFTGEQESAASVWCFKAGRARLNRHSATWDIGAEAAVATRTSHGLGGDARGAALGQLLRLNGIGREVDNCFP
jgi:hypothetical protein